MSIAQRFGIKRGKLFYPLLLMAGYVILYFILRDKFLYTPDTSGTDVFHFNISYKYHLWESIRHGEVPFWTDMLNGGFPLVAESQMGTFFLPYYLIFPLFSNFSHAYSFLFSFHLYMLSVGMYYLLRKFKTPHLLSFILSIIFTWNGSITFRWVHFTVLQAFSFTPFLFYFYLRWNESQKVRYMVAMSLIISQMMFAGFVQSVFIALLGLGCLFVLQNFPLQRRKTILFIGAVLCGILLSLPQILPTLQLSQYTSRNISSTYDFAVSVPFNINNVCSFISVDCMGSAQNATYPMNWQVSGIYWENTPYVGLTFFLLLVFASIYYFLRSKRDVFVYVFMSLFILFLLLALGKNSPVYFIFSMFPFTLFRTPPRYLLLAVFFLILYAAFVFKEVVKKNTFISLVIYLSLILNAIILIYSAFSYHLFIDSSVLYKSLAQLNVVSADSLYITYGAQREWNKLYSKWGWSTKKSVKGYLFINSALLPNTNLISGQNSFEIYASLDMRRDLLLKSIITEGLDLATNSTIESSQSARVENMLQLYGITSILSFKSLYLPDFKLIRTMNEGDLEIKIYRSPQNSNSNDYYIPQSVKKTTSVEDIQERIYKGTMTQRDSLVESIKNTIIQNNITIKMQINKKRDDYVIYNISANKTAFVVFRKKWYPGWKLYIDGKEVTFYRTNLVHIGAFIPEGTHKVELKYIPFAFYTGSSIVLSILIIGGIVLILKVRKRSE